MAAAVPGTTSRAENVAADKVPRTMRRKLDRVVAFDGTNIIFLSPMAGNATTAARNPLLLITRSSSPLM
jgi:hypothetical protein